MSEFKNKSFRLIKIMEIYTILSSKLLKGRKFLLLRYKGTSSIIQVSTSEEKQ